MPESSAIRRAIEYLDGIDEADEYVRWIDKQTKETQDILSILHENEQELTLIFQRFAETPDVSAANIAVRRLLGIRLNLKDRLVAIVEKSRKLKTRLQKEPEFQTSGLGAEISTVEESATKAIMRYRDILDAMDRLQALVRSQTFRRVAIVAGGAALVVGAAFGLPALVAAVLSQVSRITLGLSEVDQEVAKIVATARSLEPAINQERQRLKVATQE